MLDMDRSHMYLVLDVMMFLYSPELYEKAGVQDSVRNVITLEHDSSVGKNRSIDKQGTAVAYTSPLEYTTRIGRATLSITMSFCCRPSISIYFPGIVLTRSHQNLYVSVTRVGGLFRGVKITCIPYLFSTLGPMSFPCVCCHIMDRPFLRAPSFIVRGETSSCSSMSL